MCSSSILQNVPQQRQVREQQSATAADLFVARGPGGRPNTAVAWNRDHGQRAQPVAQSVAVRAPHPDVSERQQAGATASRGRSTGQPAYPGRVQQQAAKSARRNRGTHSLEVSEHLLIN